MTDEHCSASALIGYARRDLPLEELVRADDHLATCEACSDALRDLAPVGFGLLRAVSVEQGRHLTFEEIAAVVDGRASEVLDPLASQHAARCESCRNEIADLQAFDLSRSTLVSPAPVAAAAKPTFWRVLLSPAFALPAAAAAVVLLAFVVRGPGTDAGPGTAANPLHIAVALSDPTDAPVPAPSLLPEAPGQALSQVLVDRIREARTRAAAHGQPETLSLSVPAAQFPAFVNLLSTLGLLDANGAETPSARSTSARPVVVVLTIRPARAR